MNYTCNYTWRLFLPCIKISGSAKLFPTAISLPKSNPWPSHYKWDALSTEPPRSWQATILEGQYFQYYTRKVPGWRISPLLILTKPLISILVFFSRRLKSFVKHWRQIMKLKLPRLSDVIRRQLYCLRHLNVTLFTWFHSSFMSQRSAAIRSLSQKWPACNLFIGANWNKKRDGFEKVFRCAVHHFSCGVVCSVCRYENQFIEIFFCPGSCFDHLNVNECAFQNYSGDIPVKGKGGKSLFVLLNVYMIIKQSEIFICQASGFVGQFKDLRSLGQFCIVINNVYASANQNLVFISGCRWKFAIGSYLN